MTRLSKILAFTLLFASFAVPLNASACTEPRPTGSAGSATASTYVTGITGYNDKIRVTWKTTNSGTINVSLIGMGPDTGLTFTGGYNNTSYANRVVKLSTHQVVGSPTQHYWMINNVHRLDIHGMPASGSWFYHSTMNFRGASGALFGIGTGSGESTPGSGNINGKLIFTGADNGSQYTQNRWVSFPPASGCTDPVAAAAYSRGAMLARSFFPEVEVVTRQWWMS